MSIRKALYTTLFGLFICAKFNVLMAVICTHQELEGYYKDKNSVLVASPGRSGSTVLFDSLRKCCPKGYTILKTHLLVPKKSYSGKIIFIYSDPDKAAESALHMCANDAKWGKLHFEHVESSDISWLEDIGSTTCQTIDNNLLAYDALGCTKQLFYWLHAKTMPCELNQAQILAIKYENLWDETAQKAISTFLGFSAFKLAAKKTRGEWMSLSNIEIACKEYHNKGSVNEPRYSAYASARLLWENAPPFQFLLIKD